jgi:hypothetical protein
MKKIFTMLMLGTFFCSAASAQSAAETRDIEMTITLDTTTFYYYQMAEGFIIDSFEYNFQPHCAAGEPNVPWVNVLVPIDQGEEFVCYTYSYTEKTIRSPISFPGSGSSGVCTGIVMVRSLMLTSTVQQTS